MSSTRLRRSPWSPHVMQLLGITWQLGRGYSAAYLVLRLLASFIPIGQLWVAKLIVDAIVRMQTTSVADSIELTGLVAIEFVLVVLSETSTRVYTWIDSLLSDRFTVHMMTRLLKHTAALDLITIESVDFQNALERARRQALLRLSMLTALFQNLQQAVTLASLLGAIAIVGPVFAIIQAASMVPLVIFDGRAIRRRQALAHAMSAVRRHLDYLFMLGTGFEAAKEIRVYDLNSHLQQRYCETASTYHDASQALERQRMSALAWLSVVSTTVYYGTYALVVWRTATGALTFGEFVFVAGAFQRCKSELSAVSSSLNRTLESLGDVRDLFAFFDLGPSPREQTMVARSVSKRRPRRPEGLEFRHVSFAYPGEKRFALRDLSFCIAPGARVALVGENGSGKSTIVKLLCRLYDPDDGQILLDGADVRSIDPTDLRQLISVVFQDYIRFDLPVRDNIGFGRIDCFDDLTSIRDAARRSGAIETVLALPSGFEQLLGRRFEGGVELSGGQWQRIALARACMRNGRIVVFDEPTAALDPRAEHEVFAHLANLARDRIALVVSHRLTSARTADRIIVLSAGEIVEDGDHASLVAQRGHYAELFHLQTASWQRPAPPGSQDAKRIRA
jgi:ATP-binding cassette, subfamily B, bacterial